ncbi:MAG: acetylxylan esterase [Pirellulaceae bacterium]|nr:acetylxylan esterase [Pirellulaceae bacterium]
MLLRVILGALFLVSVSLSCQAQKFVANYDESKIPEFQLPDPLVTQAGKPVTTAGDWNEVRRPELVKLFAQQVYGVSPPACEIRHALVSTKNDAVGGKAIRREVDVFFGKSPDAQSMRLLIYSPKSVPNAPAFLGLNFQGNHSVDPDPSISLNDRWMRDRKNGTVKNDKATEQARGAAASRWPVEMMIDRGYALVTIYYGDIDPDFDDGFKNGIHGQFADQTKDIPENEKWGSIAAWAYGLSRALDYLQQDDTIDAQNVAVFGHSRLGKTSLWAGASDPRFKMVISNNSGCGGAALSRRAIGETIGRINTSFPHWFCDNYTQYNENENACPVDQHELLALIAPRAVYVASATGDKWADPKGEFLAASHADPVYRLLGTDGMGSNVPTFDQVQPDTPIKSGTIGYHLRTGNHDVTDFDWQQYLDFADRHLKK